MLRRDLEYVLTWDALDHCWLARPMIGPLSGDLIGRGAARVDVVDAYKNTLRDIGE
jgi:hypothetical protein